MTDYYVDDGGGKAVTAATNANPCQVTIVGHGFSNGHKVMFQNVGGMTQINFTNASAGYTVTVVDDDNITISVDSSAYGTYTSGGTAHNGLSWGASYTSLSAWTMCSRSRTAILSISAMIMCASTYTRPTFPKVCETAK